MPTLTNNFSFNKPLVNNPIDADLWGDQLNKNWDDIDATISWNVTPQAANFTVQNSSFNSLFVVDTSAGAVVVTLPPVATVFNGFVFMVVALDASNSITIQPDGSELIDGVAAYVVGQGGAVTIVCDGTAWVTTNKTPETYVSENKVVMRHSTSDPANDMVFSAGQFAFDDLSNGFASIPQLTKRLDAVWAQGDGNGGLDVGVKTNDTYYYGFAISDASGGTTDALFSADFNSPTLPTGYTKKRYTGSFYVDGSGNIRVDNRTGNRVTYVEPTEDVADAGAGTTAVNAALSVPPLNNLTARVKFYIFDTTAFNSNQFAVIRERGAAPVPTQGNCDLDYTGSSLNENKSAEIITEVYINNTDGEVSYRMNASNTGITTYINTYGYIDGNL